MTVQVAVIDPLPMFVRGTVLTLESAGHSAETPENLLDWMQGPGPRVVLLTVMDAASWTLLSGLVDVRPDASVIVVIDEPSPAVGARAIAAGAVAILPRAASPDLVLDTVRAAMYGRSLIPSEALRALVAGIASSDPRTRPLSDEEIAWLRHLSEGRTVADLADRAGYSERMMYRLLANLYRRLGVRSRTKALMLAQREGWL